MAQLPIIALVGRPNVGKSTLFNSLTKSDRALVDDFPGLTRDRQFGTGRVGECTYWVIDTGGIAEATHEMQITDPLERQVEQAIIEADHVFFLLDAEVGVTIGDEAIAKKLLSHHDKVTLVVNKADNIDLHAACSDFYKLGFQKIFGVSAKRKRGLKELINTTLPEPIDEESEDTADSEKRITVSVLGKPNVGKSTLINALLGHERVVVSSLPGTTRDSIDIDFEHQGDLYRLVDTAGVRRRTKIQIGVEKQSIGQTLVAIDRSDVMVCVLDARDSLSEQDLRLIGLVVKRGRGLVLAFNKWDDMTEADRDQFHRQVDRRLPFASFARRYTTSAKHGSGVGNLFPAIKEAYESAKKTLSTSMLTRVLEQAIKDHQPPLAGGRRIKLRLAHVGSHHPLTIVIHGKQTHKLPGSYQRYLTQYFRKSCQLSGIPIVLRLHTDDNPYDKKDTESKK